MITPPEAGEPVDQLWRTLNQVVRQLNALNKVEVSVVANSQARGVVEATGQTVVLTSPLRGGELVFNEDKASLILY